MRSRLELAGNVTVLTGLLVAGALGWWLQLQPPLVVDATPLAGLPHRLGAWRAVDLPLEPAVESVLGVDFNLQRIYARPGVDPVWLYIGYYGTAQGGRPSHTPRGCYTGAGWGIESAQVVEFDSSASLRANEYVVERAGERRLVHFWFRSENRSGMLGGLDQNVERLLGRLLRGRADGALIRISTPIERGNQITARSRLASFAVALDPAIAARWPLEMPAPEPR